MKTKSQKEIVIKQLLDTGSVSRNWCIREQYITRLSDIIFKLKEEGWDFNSKDVKENGGLNYYYFINKSPLKRIEYFVPLLNKTIIKYE